MNYVTTNIRLPEEDYLRLKSEAAKRRKSLSAVIREKVSETKSTYSSNEVKKIIKMGKNTLMAIYADSENALYWKNVMEKGELIETLTKKLPFLPAIKEYIFASWEIGVHYFKPEIDNNDNPEDMRKNWLKKNMNPDEGLYFAGEYFSEKQGFVEGAISSVDFLFENFSELS